jgi:hypothetical protein
VGELVAGIECIAIFKLVIFADRCARLHWIDGDTGEGNLNAAYVMGRFEGGVRLGFIALLHLKANVVSAFIPN